MNNSKQLLEDFDKTTFAKECTNPEWKTEMRMFAIAQVIKMYEIMKEKEQ